MEHDYDAQEFDELHNPKTISIHQPALEPLIAEQAIIAHHHFAHCLDKLFPEKKLVKEIKVIEIDIG